MTLTLWTTMTIGDLARRAGAIGAVAVVLGASGGCSTHQGGWWAVGSTDLRHEPLVETDADAVQVVKVDPSALSAAARPASHQLVATSEFVKPTPLRVDQGAAGSPLRAHAAAIGATRVHWSEARETHRGVEEFRYRAVYFRVHQAPLPMAASPTSTQPLLRVAEEAPVWDAGVRLVEAPGGGE